MKSKIINEIKELKIIDDSTRKEAEIFLELLKGQKYRNFDIENYLKDMLADYKYATRRTAFISALDMYIEKYKLNDIQAKTFLNNTFVCL